MAIFTELDTSRVSTRRLAMIFDRSEQTIKKVISASRIKTTKGERNAIQCHLGEFARALYGNDDADGDLSPSDQRNLAQAEKCKEETAILKRKHIPIEEAAQGVTLVMERLREIIDASPMDRETRAKCVTLLREGIEEIEPEDETQ